MIKGIKSNPINNDNETVYLYQHALRINYKCAKITIYWLALRGQIQAIQQE